MFEQFSALVVKQPFTMKFDGTKGRPLIAKAGDVFLVTNPKHMQDKGIKVDRKSKAHSNSGYLLSVAQIEQLFSVAS